MLLLLLGCVFSLAQGNKAPDAQLSGAAGSSYVAVHKFDPKRDAAADIQAAIAEAQRTGKRIILDIGGDWCQYCHQMDQFLQDHPDVFQLREKNFITVLIFYSSDNKNEKALSRYSKVLGIPHFFVLEKDGSLLYSQHVADLRTNGNYNVEKIKDFLSKWAPATASKRDED
jgi:thioredoxin-related protein